ncbi:hypothetical protein G3I60_05395 [Streptomyces sp. SID13666]|uniref:hypothetical protein n=1 Tax=Streptomyces sp. SID13666 TaxID=2706054 RepID=UPI0013BED00F|nr:hypothetical protein [Streptomyces sp. SID13666]NEA53606.1 hypothetical protein [Streptomyces sp. SID13666]
MADSLIPEQVDAEIKRLVGLTHKEFAEDWAAFVLGEHRRQGPDPAVWAAAFRSPQVVGRTLDTVDKVRRGLETYLPPEADEPDREYQNRVTDFRSRIKAAAQPLEAVIAELAEDEIEYLQQLDDKAFAEEWAGFVQDRSGRTRPIPRRAQALAFRSFALAFRARKASERMVKEPAPYLPAADGDSRSTTEARVRDFRSRLESEMRFLQFVIDADSARQGRMPAAPNFRNQAMRLLAKENPKRFLELLANVREEARVKREEDRKRARRNKRAGDAPPAAPASDRRSV